MYPKKMFADLYSSLPQVYSSFDIIIVGAGISGLLLATQLSSKCSVLLIEKNEAPKPKFWLTGGELWRKHSLLADCIDSKYSTMDFIAYDGTTHRGTGSAILWDSAKLVKFLLNKAVENGVVIELNNQFYSYTLNDNSILVFYENKCCSAKLLIDCMGTESILVSSENCFTPFGYYLLYGGEMELRKKMPPIALHNVVLGRKAYMFEVFPTKNETAHTLLIAPVKSYRSEKSIKQAYCDITSRTLYAEYFGKSINSYSGIVPVGLMKKKALERVFLWGEGALIQPPASAVCLHRALSTYKTVAKRLLYCIENDCLDAKNLSKCIVHIPLTSQLIQFKLFKSLLNANPRKFKRIVTKMSRIDDALLEKCMLGEISLGDVINIKKITQLIRYL